MEKGTLWEYLLLWTLDTFSHKTFFLYNVSTSGFVGWFRLTSVIELIRSSFLTYAWICIVRRHLKEVNEIVQRPKLQTIISIGEFKLI